MIANGHCAAFMVLCGSGKHKHLKCRCLTSQSGIVYCSYTAIRAKQVLKQFAKHNVVTGVSFLTANHMNVVYRKCRVKLVAVPTFPEGNVIEGGPQPSLLCCHS